MSSRSASIVSAAFLLCACGDKDDGSNTQGLTASDTNATLTTSVTATTTTTTSTTGSTVSASGTVTSDGTDATSATDSGTTTGTTGDPPKFDVGVMTTGADLPKEDCIECTLTIASQQSGTFEITGNAVFATATLMNQIVYAIGNYGAGRFIATADSSLPYNEVTQCPLHAWLAGHVNPNPPIFTFGWTQSDGPKNFSPPNETVGGVHLPAQYIGDPAALRADYDIVIYLEASGQFDQGDQPSDAEIQTILDFAQIHGGGLYISSEFSAGNAYLNPTDIASVNRALLPLGVEAQAVSLNWGNVDGNIEFQCFPNPEG